MEKTHSDLVFEVSQKVLSGILSGPMYSCILIDHMKAGERATLGQMMVNEAWEMADCLVTKYARTKQEQGGC